MKIKLILISIFFLLILYSCDQEETGFPVFAGSYDAHLQCREFSPAKSMHYDSTSMYRKGIDSLDVNQDGLYDLFITQRLLFDFDVNERGSFTYDTYPYTGVSLRNGLEVATQTTWNAMGHGEIQKQFWVDVLMANVRVDQIRQWSEPNKGHSLWFVSPSIFQGSFGTWFNLWNSLRYIGIRKKTGSKYKYGWVQIRQLSLGEIVIEGMAIEK